MFVLRKITADGVEMNIAIGNNYTLVNPERCSEEFERTLKMQDKSIRDKIYAFIFDESGKAKPLYKAQKAFIMTENGKTFDNVSLR